MKRPGWCPTHMFSDESDDETEEGALKLLLRVRRAARSMILNQKIVE